MIVRRPSLDQPGNPPGTLPTLRLTPALIGALSVTLLASPGMAQSDSSRHAGVPGFVPGFVPVASPADEHARVLQLTGAVPATRFLLRSPSAGLGAIDSAQPLTVALVPPQVTFQHNSDIAFSMNDGALWAGRGANLLARAGFVAEWWRVRLVVVPEVTYSANEAYALVDPSIYPPPGPEWSPYASPWFLGEAGIDFPLRMGDRAIRRLTPGQSVLLVDAGPVSIGGGTENQWWGPGMWNALVLSNNAPGFPHVFVRTSRPVDTRIGSFDARLLVGGLQESDFYDGDPDNDLRSIGLLGLTWEPWFDRNLTLGAARAVFAPAGGWRDVFTDAYQVFADVGAPNLRTDFPQPVPAGRDQLFSLFFRWLLPGTGLVPGEGAEVYGEWGRAAQPRSVRDFMLEPNHSQAYTVGAQWLGSRVFGVGRFRARGELSNLEKAPTFKSRPLDTWYVSRAVDHGYTHRGEVLGAAIGPGSSSQNLAAGFVSDWWDLEGVLTRIRWQNDVQAEPISYTDGQGWCEHDVTFTGGARGNLRSRYGSVSLTFLTGKRYNPFFSPRQPTCPGTNIGDVQNQTFSLTFSPSLGWMR